MAAPDNSAFALRQLLEEFGAQLRSGVEKLGDLPHETGDLLARELGLATRRSSRRSSSGSPSSSTGSSCSNRTSPLQTRRGLTPVMSR